MEELKKILESLKESHSLFRRDLVLPNEMNIPFVEAKADISRAIKKIKKMVEQNGKD